MPAKRKTSNYSPQTMHKWLKVHVVEASNMIEEERLYEDQGKKVIKGLEYAIRALEDSYAEFKRLKRAKAEQDYKEARDKFV